MLKFMLVKVLQDHVISCFSTMYHMFTPSTDYFYQSHYTVTDVNYFICNVVAYQNIINGEKFSSAIS